MKTHKRWTITQLNLMERLIAAAKQTRKPIPWMQHQKDIGHSLPSIYNMATTIRERQNRPIKRGILKSLRERVDDGIRERSKFRIVARPVDEEKKPAEIDHRSVTTRFTFDPHIRNRILDQGITAGLLGDPIPGRSAFDRKKAEAAL